MSTYRKEWDCCGSVTETYSWEPETCPFCTDAVSPFAMTNEQRGALAYELTKRIIIDMPTARAAIDESLKNSGALMVSASPAMMASALDCITRRLQMDVDAGSRPDHSGRWKT